MSKLYISLRSPFTYSCCDCGLVRFWHKDHLVWGLEKTCFFCSPGFVVISTAGNLLSSNLKYLVFLPLTRNILTSRQICPVDIALLNVEMLSLSRISGLTSHLSRNESWLINVMWAWYEKYCRNVDMKCTKHMEVSVVWRKHKHQYFILCLGCKSIRWRTLPKCPASKW